MKANKIKALDLFCGVGGLTYGLRKAGIDVVAGVDIDPACAYPYERNNAALFIQQDVATLTGDQVRELLGTDGVRLLAGCAPCQPFSAHSKGKDTSSDPKWPLLDQFARLVEDVLPELVTMENVVRIQRHAVFHRFVDKLRELGYDAVWGSLYCPDFGIAQERRRLVLLASRIGDVSLPNPTHAEADYVTVRAAIGRLPRLANGDVDPFDRLHTSRKVTEINMKRLKCSRPGGTWKDWPNELRSPCHAKGSGQSFRSVYGRMEWDQPSPTITTQYYNFGTGRFGHPDQDRALTLREGAILQSFPEDYELADPNKRVIRTTVGRLVGNAVPPRLGEVIGNALLRKDMEAL